MHDFDKNSGGTCPFMAEADALDAEKQKQAQAATAAANAAASAAPSDAAGAEMSAEEEIASLHAQLAQAKAQAKEEALAENKDQLLRAAAEVQNARRRAEDEVSKARKFALEGFAESLLPVLDSLEAGLAVQDATVEQIREGAELTVKQLLAALERNKVLPIAPAAGDKFDPNQHQAISAVPADQPANTVVTVLQKGYSIADRVLRPALIMVAAEK
jgi:molecular chaperone GrpE